MSLNFVNFEELVNQAVEGPSLTKENLALNLNYHETVKHVQSFNESSIAQAACSYMLEDYDKVLNFLTSIYPVPDSSESDSKGILLGLTNEKTGNFEKSIEFLLSANWRGLRKPEVLYEKVVSLYIRLKNWTQCIKYYESSKNQYTQTSSSYCKIGFCYENLGETQKSIDFYENSSQFNTPLGKVSGLWARVLKNENILEDFNSFLQYFENDSLWANDCKYIKSLYLLRNNKFDESVQVLKELCETASHQNYWLTLGFVYIKKNNITQAFSSTLKAIKIDKNMPEGWFNLAVIYNKVRQEEYLNALKKAQRLGLDRDLNEAVNVSLELWNLGKSGKKEVPVVKAKEKKKPEIIVPTVVKNCCFQNGMLQIQQGMLMNYYLKYVNDINKTAESNEEDKEAANILTHLELPTKRFRKK